MSQLSAIRDRRRAIINLRKVTKAMELVTKTKIAKMRLNAKNAHNYQQGFYQLASTVLGQTQSEAKQPVEPIRFIVGFFSQKGFCGSFNEKLMSRLSSLVKLKQPQQLYLVGKRTSKWSYVLKRDFLHIEAREKTYQQELQPLIQHWQKILSANQPLEIYFVYNKLHTILDQKPVQEKIYPFATKLEKTPAAIVFEPAQNLFAEQVLSAYLGACLEKTYWESVAGEYCSRLLSMKNANDNASLIIDALHLEYNKTRQSKITQELSEVVSAFDVLKMVQEKKQQNR